MVSEELWDYEDLVESRKHLMLQLRKYVSVTVLQDKGDFKIVIPGSKNGFYEKLYVQWVNYELGKYFSDFHINSYTNNQTLFTTLSFHWNHNHAVEILEYITRG